MRRRGVTLIELVCALAVAMLLLAAAVSVVGPLLRAGRLSAGEDAVVGTLRSARALAIVGGEVYAVRFDTAPEPPRLLVYGSLRGMPDATWNEAQWKADARYAGVSARLPKDMRVVRASDGGVPVDPIWFRPDGSAGPPGGAFAYDVRGGDDRRRRITVLETTGLVRGEP